MRLTCQRLQLLFWRRPHSQDGAAIELLFWQCRRVLDDAAIQTLYANADLLLTQYSGALDEAIMLQNNSKEELARSYAE